MDDFDACDPVQPYLILVLMMVAAVAAGIGTRVLARHVVGANLPSEIPIVLDAVVVIWAWITVPMPIVLPLTCVLGWTLVALAACDAMTYRLPDMLILPLIVVGLALSWWLPEGDIMGHVIGALAGFAIFALIAFAYERARGHEGLGLGDAKLAAASGAWLGWEALPSVILVGAVGGLLFVAVRYATRGRDALGSPVPFGVPLCFAFWLTWLYGPLVPTL